MNKLYLFTREQGLKKVGNFDRMDEVFQQNPGAYTVFRTYYENKTLYLDLHLQRIRKSSAALGISYEFKDGELRRLLGEILTENPTSQYRVGLLAVPAQPTRIFILLEKFIPLPFELYQSGVRVDTVYLEREDPKTKRSEFSLTREKIYHLHPDVHEVIMISPGGKLLEGLSSNFFGMMNGELFTASRGILPGITRTLLLKSAAKVLPVNLKAISIAQKNQLEEAFITSSSRGVLPVCQIDSETVGTGKPGKLTKAITEAFNVLLNQELRPINPKPFEH